MPDSTPLRMYRREQTDKPAIPWGDVERRLQEAIVYWLCAGSAARPIWGVWHDEALWLSIGSPTVGRGLRSSPSASAHLEDGHDVVIVEGTHRTESDESALARFCDVYNAKYAWDMTPSSIPGPIVVLTPDRVLAYRAGSWRDAKTDPFPLAASKFTFG